MSVVNDIHRPDIGGVPPRMKAIAEQFSGIELPYLRVSCDDNLCSSVILSGSLEGKEEWQNGIFHNSPYFIVRVGSKEKRWYDVGDTVVVELISSNLPGIPKFRKYSSSADKVVAKVRVWISGLAAKAEKG